MGKFGIIRDHEHKERVKRKHEDIATLRALKETWEGMLEPDDPLLKYYERRIHKLEVQLQAMRP